VRVLPPRSPSCAVPPFRPCPARAHTLAPLSSPCSDGGTPLHGAASNGHAPVVAALLADPRVEVNAKDEGEGEGGGGEGARE